MKTLIFILITIIAPFVLMAGLSISYSLTQWMSKQFHKLKSNKTGRVIAKVLSFIGTIIGIILMYIFYRYADF